MHLCLLENNTLLIKYKFIVVFLSLVLKNAFMPPFCCVEIESEFNDAARRHQPIRKVESILRRKIKEEFELI